MADNLKGPLMADISTVQMRRKATRIKERRYFEEWTPETAHWIRYNVLTERASVDGTKSASIENELHSGFIATYTKDGVKLESTPPMEVNGITVVWDEKADMWVRDNTHDQLSQAATS